VTMLEAHIRRLAVSFVLTFAAIIAIHHSLN
jgi:hypothetical protein